MIQSVGTNFNKDNISFKRLKKQENKPLSFVSSQNAITPIYSANYLSQLGSSMSVPEMRKYLFLVDKLKGLEPAENSDGLTPNQQLDLLFKNGKLLRKSHNDNSTTLDNLYDIYTQKRTAGLDNIRVLRDTLDLLSNPRFVTQTFGDIPISEKPWVLSLQDKNSEVVKNPYLMDVEASGTCAAASNEVNLADKYPADFALWVSKLSSENRELYLNIDLKAISKNELEAMEILNFLSADNRRFSFSGKNKIKVTLDDNAYIRAKIQNDHWDKGERNIADVLVQSAIMGLGSQNTYNSLTDTRAATFNDNTQGLVEVEKTFVESLIKNKETTSLVYQQIDDNQCLVGYTCPFEKMEQHITDTINGGDDVIIGYVLTNETAGETRSPNYDPSKDGAPNMVINGHEITIVDYFKGEDEQTQFLCIDTDDDSPELVRYSAKWLLPKIHHAGYPAHIVEKDEKEIMAKLQ